MILFCYCLYILISWLNAILDFIQMADVYQIKVSWTKEKKNYETLYQQSYQSKSSIYLMSTSIYYDSLFIPTFFGTLQIRINIGSRDHLNYAKRLVLNPSTSKHWDFHPDKKNPSMHNLLEHRLNRQSVIEYLDWNTFLFSLFAKI